MPFYISIIIPTSRSAKIREETFQSISQAAMDNDVEVLVVENGVKNDNFQNKVLSYGFRYYHEPVEGLLAARHHGVQKAKGDILVFIDDDVILSESWITAVRQTFTDVKVHLATGPSRPLFLGSKPDWLDSFWVDVEPDGRALYQLSLLELSPCIQKICPTLVWGLNFGIRKETLFNLGGFHPDGVPWEMRKYRGDGESGLARKAKDHDLTAVYNPQMALEHIVPLNRMTIEYFEKRSYLEGISSSYAQKRQEPPQIKPSPDVNSDSIPKKPFWKRILSKIMRISLLILRPKRSTATKDSNLLSLQDRINLKQKEGYEFHREEMEKDPLLVKWVVKENYWDFTYPSETLKEA